ncbi:MAG: hypothetical protein AAGI38_12940 [Bacteroidota bacterium]
MARINGTNSDYVFDAVSGGVVEVPDPKPAVEMRLFICPYDMPNTLEDQGSEPSRCIGIDEDCPNPTKSGHALMHLHQNDGITLRTDNRNILQLTQNGDIQLRPSTGGQAEVRGIFEVRQASGNTVLLEVGPSDVRIRAVNGAEVVIRSNGNIDLITENNAGTVNIQGNLVVSGTIN